MTDKQLLKLARRIDVYADRIRDLCSRISASGHPKADRINSRLIDNELPPTGGRAEQIANKVLEEKEEA